MPSIKSPYFTEYGGDSDEQTLVQDLVDEQIQLFGQEVIYIAKQMLIDRNLSDVIMKKYEDTVEIEMMLINVEGFGGSAAATMTKFGLRLTDEITYTVSRRRWLTYAESEVHTFIAHRPNEGDLIYVPMTNNLYEIKFVEREVPFYQLGKNYTFTLSCELIENADNYFHTGNAAIDDLKKEAYVFPVTVKSGGTGAFIVGEKVSQTYTIDGSPVTVEATVADWDPTNKKLKLTYINGALQQNLPLIGEDSGATWDVDTFSTLDFQVDNYDFAENKWYEDQADQIIDFSEGNPFGEFGDMGVF